jgi:hypothetical protein
MSTCPTIAPSVLTTWCNANSGNQEVKAVCDCYYAHSLDCCRQLAAKYGVANASTLTEEQCFNVMNCQLNAQVNVPSPSTASPTFPPTASPSSPPVSPTVTDVGLSQGAIQGISYGSLGAAVVVGVILFLVFARSNDHVNHI